MTGVLLCIGYDGTDFAGWQRQPNARTVQRELERAASTMAKEPIAMRGASRTDAGVHAEGQLASFVTSRAIPMEGWVQGLNRLLPADVSVRSAAPCSEDYLPRFAARSKEYRYVLHTARERDPLTRRFAWHLGKKRTRASRNPRDTQLLGTDGLNFEAMELGAEALLGEHDFRAFRASDDGREHTVRTLFSLHIVRPYLNHPDLCAVYVEGSGFLKHMVRILVGTLVEVGRGRLTSDDLRAAVTAGADRAHLGLTAPAHGLTLVRIDTGNESSRR